MAPWPWAELSSALAEVDSIQRKHTATDVHPQKMLVELKPLASHTLAWPSSLDVSMGTEMAAHCGGEGSSKLSFSVKSAVCLDCVYRSLSVAIIRGM